MVCPVPCVGKAGMQYTRSLTTPRHLELHTCAMDEKIQSDLVTDWSRKSGFLPSMLSSWSPFPALSIRSVWGSNPRPLINVAAVVVGSILSFLWSHDGSDFESLRGDVGSLTDAVMYLYTLIASFISYTRPETGQLTINNSNNKNTFKF